MNMLCSFHLGGSLLRCQGHTLPVYVSKTLEEKPRHLHVDHGVLLVLVHCCVVPCHGFRILLLILVLWLLPVMLSLSGS